MNCLLPTALVALQFTEQYQQNDKSLGYMEFW